MMDDLEDLSCHRLHALKNIEANKLRVARHYNKKVKDKQFSEGELVWKVKLSIIRFLYTSADKSFCNVTRLDPIRTSQGRTALWPYTSS